MDQKKLYILVFIIILIILAIVFFAPREKKMSDVPTSTPEEIIIQEVNEEEGPKVAPEGLPEGVPVGTTITESYTLEYPDRDLTQHSVTFISQSTFENLISQYETYIDEEGFTISSRDTQDEFATIYATREEGDLSVVISRQAEGNQVQLTYLERN